MHPSRVAVLCGISQAYEAANTPWGAMLAGVPRTSRASWSRLRAFSLLLTASGATSRVSRYRPLDWWPWPYISATAGDRQAGCCALWAGLASVTCDIDVIRADPVVSHPRGQYPPRRPARIQRARDQCLPLETPRPFCRASAQPSQCLSLRRGLVLFSGPFAAPVCNSRKSCSITLTRPVASRNRVRMLLRSYFSQSATSRFSSRSPRRESALTVRAIARRWQSMRPGSAIPHSHLLTSELDVPIAPANCFSVRPRASRMRFNVSGKPGKNSFFRLDDRLHPGARPAISGASAKSPCDPSPSSFRRVARFCCPSDTPTFQRESERWIPTLCAPGAFPFRFAGGGGLMDYLVECTGRFPGALQQILEQPYRHNAGLACPLGRSDQLVDGRHVEVICQRDQLPDARS